MPLGADRVDVGLVRRDAAAEGVVEVGRQDRPKGQAPNDLEAPGHRRPELLGRNQQALAQALDQAGPTEAVLEQLRREVATVGSAVALEGPLDAGPQAAADLASELAQELDPGRELGRRREARADEGHAISSDDLLREVLGAGREGLAELDGRIRGHHVTLHLVLGPIHRQQ